MEIDENDKGPVPLEPHTPEIDSDSENDINYTRKSVHQILDSESDSEMIGKVNDLEIPLDRNKSLMTKRLAIADSDSDDHNSCPSTPTPHNKSFEDNFNVSVHNVNNPGELIPEPSTHVKSRLSALVDSDSSNEDDEVKTPQYVEVTKSKKSKVLREKKQKPITGKQAAELRKEIQSESQRMLRESKVSLPYHKPKSYSLKEFLERRSKLPSALPSLPKGPPSIAIKMSRDQLETVSKKLDERMKEVEEFYKSESESDHEDVSTQLDHISIDIRSWLDVLADDAVDTVEEKNSTDETVEEAVENMLPSLGKSEVDHDGKEAEKNVKVSDLFWNKLVLTTQPRLSGGPDEVIDLDEGVTKPNEFKQFVRKFLHNTATKAHQKHKIQMNVVTLSHGEILKETVTMNVDDEDEASGANDEVPGAKLRKLRSELQNQMALKRSEMWKSKKNETICPVKEGDCCNQSDSDYLDDEDDEDEEEEAEMTETSEEDEERIKPITKSAFVDDEAEVSENDEDVDNYEMKLDMSDELEQPKRKNALKRIARGFNDDSDEEVENSPKKAERTHLDSTASNEDELMLPPNLPRDNVTPQRPEQNQSDVDFLTPISYLTGLQNLNSGSKFLKDSPVLSPFRIPKDPLQSPLQKQLFQDGVEASQTQSMDDLSMLCSGKFPTTQEYNESKIGEENSSATTQDFGDFTLNGENDSDVLKPQSIAKNLDDEPEQLISQLLNEDELEQFKKKFQSPVLSKEINQSFSDILSDDAIAEVNATGVLMSDDDDDNDDGLGISKKVKKQKKLTFSDDEDSDEDSDDEEIDLHDGLSDISDRNIDDIAYDSEENEVDAKTVAQKLKIGDFVENEAELSESEWGSADEDEKDLDEMDAEKGDEETFDDDQVKSDLEKIHMRRLLDDDTREVKILQELLLEDGEMHGAGRQRQFKWRNIDSANFGEDGSKEDDDLFAEEEESEENFRKMRHQREMFLKEKTNKDDIATIISGSQVLKMGETIIKKSVSFNSQSSTSSNEPVDELKVKPLVSFMTKRGSFLNRSDQVLARLAEYTKVSETIRCGTKNVRSFTFKTVASSSKADSVSKRKAEDGTPPALKKFKVTDFSPFVKKKSGTGPESGKNLFPDW